MVEYSCDYCGKKATKPPSRYNEDQKNYCNQECMIKDRKNDKTIKCEKCGEKFTAQKAQEGNFVQENATQNTVQKT